MRTTICYGMMFISLGSALVYTVAHADELGNPLGDPRVFVTSAGLHESPIVIQAAAPAAPRATAAVAAPATSVSKAAPVVQATARAPAAARSEPAISPGMTSDEITLTLGEPDMMSDDGSRWTYGATVFIFNDEDRLAGTVGFDPVQAAINKYNSMMVSMVDEADASGPRRTAKGGPRVLSRSASAYSTGKRYRPMTAASSRNAFRYSTQGNEYSYYMNRYGPMDRVFLRKPSLPRGMTTVYDRNLGRTYQSLGNRTQYASPNFQYRR